MRKLAVALLSIALIAISGVTALAAESPELPTEICTETCTKICRKGWSRRWGYDYYYDGYQQVAYGRVVDMSPKTGVSDSDAMFAVLGVLACGSLAVVAKKKMSE